MAALAALALLATIAGCFQVQYSCRITCSAEQKCPSGTVCLMESGASAGLCATAETTSCSLPPGDDAGAGGLEAGSDGPNGTDGSSDAADESLPPPMLCHQGSCLSLTEAVRANLALLLWPSNLPAVGSPVAVWRDQSGQGNDAQALYPTALPQVDANGVKLDVTTPGSGFYVENSPSLDFGSGDFAVIVVAGLVSNNRQVALFTKADSARPGAQRQVTLDWKLSSAVSGRPRAIIDDTQLVASLDTPQPSVAVYSVQRVVDHIELRLNGSVLGSDDLPPGTSTTNSEGIYLGVGSLEGWPADTLRAVLVLRGGASASDLSALESFLRTLFAEPR